MSQPVHVDDLRALLDPKTRQNVQILGKDGKPLPLPTAEQFEAFDRALEAHRQELLADTNPIQLNRLNRIRSGRRRRIQERTAYLEALDSLATDGKRVDAVERRDVQALRDLEVLFDFQKHHPEQVPEIFQTLAGDFRRLQRITRRNGFHQSMELKHLVDYVKYHACKMRNAEQDQPHIEYWEAMASHVLKAYPLVRVLKDGVAATLLQRVKASEGIGRLEQITELKADLTILTKNLLKDGVVSPALKTGTVAENLILAMFSSNVGKRDEQQLGTTFRKIDSKNTTNEKVRWNEQGQLELYRYDENGGKVPVEGQDLIDPQKTPILWHCPGSYDHEQDKAAGKELTPKNGVKIDVSIYEGGTHQNLLRYASRPMLGLRNNLRRMFGQQEYIAPSIAKMRDAVLMTLAQRDETGKPIRDVNGKLQLLPVEKMQEIMGRQSFLGQSAGGMIIHEALRLVSQEVDRQHPDSAGAGFSVISQAKVVSYVGVEGTSVDSVKIQTVGDQVTGTVAKTRNPVLGPDLLDAMKARDGFNTSQASATSIPLRDLLDPAKIDSYLKGNTPDAVQYLFVMENQAITSTTKNGDVTTTIGGDAGTNYNHDIAGCMAVVGGKRPDGQGHTLPLIAVYRDEKSGEMVARYMGRQPVKNFIEMSSEKKRKFVGAPTIEASQARDQQPPEPPRTRGGAALFRKIRKVCNNIASPARGGDILLSARTT